MRNNKIFNILNINKNVLDVKYAVRGPIVDRSNQLIKMIKHKDKSTNLKKIFKCNIGNPQAMGQKPLTFIRQVLSLSFLPSLDNKGIFPSDVIKRSKRYLNKYGQIGEYTHSQGMESIRESVANYIKNRDSVETNADEIFLSDGASFAIKTVLNMLISSKNDGIMIPVPQYPLYSATISMLGGKCAEYYLDEDNNWSIDINEIERSYQEAVKNGINLKAIVIINPGNPTGHLIEKNVIEKIIEFSNRRKLLLLADEVYQLNVYDEKKPFYSFKKAISQMSNKKLREQELISFNSISKGVFGECGLRGGYVDFYNIDKEILDIYYKIVTVNLCPNITGQIGVDIACDPPKKGDPSFELFDKEYKEIFNSLKRRSKIVSKRLSNIKSIKCDQTSGSLYVFPRIDIPEHFYRACLKLNVEPDEKFCQILLEETGICTVSGSGFKQRKNTFHLRLTILPPEEEIEEVMDSFKNFYINFLEKRYDHYIS